jgi:hypothetical protein
MRHHESVGGRSTAVGEVRSSGKGRSLPRWLGALACVVSLSVPETAWAFKTKTHVASANEVLDQLSQVITADPTAPTP